MWLHYPAAGQAVMPGSKVSEWVAWWHSVNISQLTQEPELPFTAPDGNCGLRPCSLFPAHCSMTDTMRSWRYEEHSSFLNSNIPEQNFREFYFSESDHSILLNEPLRVSADWQWVHWPRLTAWSSGYPHKNTRTQGSHVPTPGTGPGHLLAFTNITILWRVTSSWEYTNQASLPKSILQASASMKTCLQISCKLYNYFPGNLISQANHFYWFGSNWWFASRF